MFQFNLRSSIILLVLFAAAGGYYWRITRQLPLCRLEAPEKVNFGIFEQNEKVQKKVLITNSGNVPLSILCITPSCGCTSAKLEGESILPPSQSREISVTLNTGKGRLGSTLAVEYSSGKQLRKTVSIHIDAWQLPKDDIFLDSGEKLIFGTLIPGDQVLRKFSVFGRLDTLGKLRFQSNQACISFQPCKPQQTKDFSEIYQQEVKVTLLATPNINQSNTEITIYDQRKALAHIPTSYEIETPTKNPNLTCFVGRVKTGEGIRQDINLELFGPLTATTEPAGMVSIESWKQTGSMACVTLAFSRVEGFTGFCSGTTVIQSQYDERAVNVLWSGYFE